jgi:hypothetical protein
MPLIVVVVCRTQSIEGFLVSQASAAAKATAAAGGAKRRKSSAPGAGPLSSSRDAAAAEADGEGVFGADGLFSNASLHLQAAAAEEAAAAAELAAAPPAAAAAAAEAGAIDSAETQQLRQHEELLRPMAQPRLPAVQTQLLSVWELLGEVQDGVHGELQQLFRSHTWVGMVRVLAAMGQCKGQCAILFSVLLTFSVDCTGPAPSCVPCNN